MALQPKLLVDAAAAIRAVMSDISENDILNTLAAKITDKFVGIIDNLVTEITNAKNFLEAVSETGFRHPRHRKSC
jgi:hypothetical protein